MYEQTKCGTITAMLRKLWLWSPERRAALKRDNNTCQMCGKKASKAKGKEFKVEVHHKDGTPLKKVVELIRKYLLVNPDKLETLCRDCHKKKHGGK